jgi:catechol 2,3-dioxygenase-like lactoylglutathione lyase family enzyme
MPYIDRAIEFYTDRMEFALISRATNEDQHAQYNGSGSTIRFLKEIEKFKTCERTCHTTRAGRSESNAEHSWHLAVFLILLENEEDIYPISL